jgi:hypothetical protein
MEKNMEDLRDTPFGSLEPFLLEMGYLAGYAPGETFKPSVSLNENGGLRIVLDGPDATLQCTMTPKEPTD